jgi:hypothetical protein
MKRSACNRKSFLGFTIAMMIVAWVVPSGARGSVSYSYDLFTLDPDVLPSTGTWTYGGGGTRTVSDPSNILTLNDNSGAAGPYFTKSLTTATISPTTEYESRSRVKITSDNNAAGFLYLQEMFDGTRYMAWATAKVGANTRFYIANLTGGTLAGTVAVDLPGTDFFQVDMKKTGTTGTAADSIVLSVDGTPIISTTYNLLPSFASVGIGWGDESSPDVGVTLLTGASFGIGEAAPELLNMVPEPSTVALGAVGLALTRVSRRARSRK